MACPYGVHPTAREQPDVFLLHYCSLRVLLIVSATTTVRDRRVGGIRSWHSAQNVEHRWPRALRSVPPAGPRSPPRGGDRELRRAAGSMKTSLACSATFSAGSPGSSFS